MLIPFVGGWIGDPLLVRTVEGEVIRVGLAGAKLKTPVDPEDGTPLGSTPESTDEYAPYVRHAPPNAGVIYVRELSLSSGQTVHLRAFVEPRATGAAYREASGGDTAPFAAVRDVVIVDE